MGLGLLHGGRLRALAGRVSRPHTTSTPRTSRSGCGRCALGAHVRLVPALPQRARHRWTRSSALSAGRSPKLACSRDLGALQHRRQAADREIAQVVRRARDRERGARAALRRRRSRLRRRGRDRRLAATSSSPAATSGCSGHAAPGSSGAPRAWDAVSPTVPTFDCRSLRPGCRARRRRRSQGPEPRRCPRAASTRSSTAGLSPRHSTSGGRSAATARPPGLTSSRRG